MERSEDDISLTPELAQLVQERLATGRYASPSEVIRAGLRMLAARDQLTERDSSELRASLLRGEQALTSARLLESAKLFTSAVLLVRERLRREHPGATVEEIELRVAQWVHERADGDVGDGPGRLVSAERLQRIRVADQLAALLRITADLERLGYRHAVVGGLAMGARTRPRTTKAVDVSVAVVADAEAEKLIRLLRASGYRDHQIFEHATTGRLMTVRLFVPGSTSVDPDVDLLFATSGIENEIVAGAERLLVLGTLVPVASRAHLLAMKILAERETRPHDRTDILALLKTVNADDLEQARRAMALIGERGYDRGKDLSKLLAEFLRVAGLIG